MSELVLGTGMPQEGGGRGLSPVLFSLYTNEMSASLCVCALVHVFVCVRARACVNVSVIIFRMVVMTI